MADAKKEIDVSLGINGSTKEKIRSKMSDQKRTSDIKDDRKKAVGAALDKFLDMDDSYDFTAPRGTKKKSKNVSSKRRDDLCVSEHTAEIRRKKQQQEQESADSTDDDVPSRTEKVKRRSSQPEAPPRATPSSETSNGGQEKAPSRKSEPGDNQGMLGMMLDSMASEKPKRSGARSVGAVPIPRTRSGRRARLKASEGGGDESTPLSPVLDEGSQHSRRRRSSRHDGRSGVNQSERASQPGDNDGRLGALLDGVPKKKKRGAKSVAGTEDTRRRNGVERSTSSTAGRRTRRPPESSRVRRTKSSDGGPMLVEVDDSEHAYESVNGAESERPRRDESPRRAKKESKRSVRRHHSMQPGTESPTKPPKQTVERSAPPRAQSMMLHREQTRRGGKSESLANVTREYTEEELPSTSYFASNHVLVNRERMKRGLRPLSRNRAMDELARDHAANMATTAGHTPIQATFVGNMLRGASIRAIHRSTMMQRDGRERHNILNPYFQEFGVGTAKGDDGMLYMCQLFSESISLTCTDATVDG